MNRQRDFDDVVTSWMDDGPEAAPDRFVWAALEQVDRAPQRSAWRVALENMPMYTKLAIPIAGVAAVLIVAVFVFGGLNGPTQVADPPSPEATPAPTPSPAACGVTPSSDGGIHVVWCSTGENATVVDFSMDAPTTWADQAFTRAESVYLRPEEGGVIAFSRFGPDTIDEWLAQLEGEEAFQLTDPEAITVGGMDAFVFDARLADGADPAEAPPVLDDPEVPIFLRGIAARVWLVGYPDDAIAIVTTVPETESNAWLDEVGAAVETIEWAP
jgi:hypothetical protein